MEDNNMRDTMVSNYGDEKLNKNKELNENMTITNKEPDEYTQKIHNLGGER